MHLDTSVTEAKTTPVEGDDPDGSGSKGRRIGSTYGAAMAFMIVVVTNISGYIAAGLDPSFARVMRVISYFHPHGAGQNLRGR